MCRIADRGVKFSNFHTTALCSPTRASLLTGRNATSNLSAFKGSWPLGRGFERFYGFLGGESNQWYPDLVTAWSCSSTSSDPPVPGPGFEPTGRTNRT